MHNLIKYTQLEKAISVRCPNEYLRQYIFISSVEVKPTLRKIKKLNEYNVGQN